MLAGPPDSGFTLLELIVVLTLMSIILAVTAPKLAGRNQQAALRGVGQDVLTMASAARSRAVLSGQPIGLLFSRNGTVLHLVEVQLDKGKAKLADLLPPRSLPEGYRTGFQWAGQRPKGMTEPVLFFRPDGSAPAGILQVTDPSKGMLRFQLFEPLGQLRLLASS